METVHESVLLDEVLDMMAIPQDGSPLVVLDATLGGGGHAAAILKQSSGVSLIGFDQDALAIERARHRVRDAAGRVFFVHGNFADLEQLLDSVPEERFGPSGAARQVGRILIDLGISSDQLDDGERGFSFRFDGPLDMRMDRSQGRTAADILNNSSARELERLFSRGGVPAPVHRRIADEVIRKRPVETTFQFAEICRRVTPRTGEGKKKDAATLPFQALRMEVNGELEKVERALPQAFNRLAPGGRLLVISFHSLEDRAVAGAMRKWGRDGQLPPGVPIRGDSPVAGKLLTPSAIVPTEAETERNPRSRSARMRVFEKSIHQTGVE